jgi:hypothetical protein
MSTMISGMQNKPTSNGKRVMPLWSSENLKVNLGMLVMGSGPMQLRRRPKAIPIRFFTMLPPSMLLTATKAMTAKEKYSKGPNFSAARAIKDANEIMKITPTIPPKKDEKSPRLSARPDFPCLLMGCASKQVVIEEGVPGMLSNVAEMNPPETPPM